MASRKAELVDITRGQEEATTRQGPSQLILSEREQRNLVKRKYGKRDKKTGLSLFPTENKEEEKDVKNGKSDGNIEIKNLPLILFL